MQEILQKQGMVGGKQMRFRCRKTPVFVSIQVYSSGTSPKLQSKTITPSSSTQYVKPDSSYDGLSQVTVNGDSNLVNSNIRYNKTIFGVIGGYFSPSGLTAYTIEQTLSSRTQTVTLDLTQGNSYINNLWGLSFVRVGYDFTNNDGDISGAAFIMPTGESMLTYIQTRIKIGTGAIVGAGGRSWKAFTTLSQNRYLTIKPPSFTSSSGTTAAYFTATKYVFNIVAYAW